MDITGRLTGDAQVRTLSDSRQVVNFSLAVSDSYRAKNGERVTNTEFFDCSYWISAGIAPYLKRGSIVELSGRVSTRAWLDAEGQPKAGLNFHTSKITLHGASGKDAVADGKPQAKDSSKAAPAKVMEVHEAVVVGTGVAPDDDLPF
jgi:single-strand DNA-binding protein